MPDRPAPPPVPADYQIGPDDFLGEGTYGQVWRALYKGSQPRAVKIFKPRAVREALWVEEYEKLKALDEPPGIITLYDRGRLGDGQPWYAMRLMADCQPDGQWEGRTLQRALARQLIPAGHHWRMILDLAETLAFLHRQGVVHCDLKPGNILLSEGPEPRPVLCDFGQSRRSGALSGAAWGTLLYSSPQQLEEPEISWPHWDVYSFGVVAWEILTGALPRLGSLQTSGTLDHGAIETLTAPDATASGLDSGSGLSGTAAKIRQETLAVFTPPAGTAEEWDVIRNCLSVEASGVQARPRDMLAVAAALRQAPVRRALRQERRKRIVLAALSVLALTGGGIAVRQSQIAGENAAAASVSSKKAVEAAAEARSRLRDSLVRGAELAMQRGQWAVSLKLTDEALALPGPDEAGLLLLKFQASDAGNSINTTRAILTQLKGLPLTPQQYAQVQCLEGERLWLEGKKEEGQSMMRTALAAGLPEEEAATARGLLAETLSGSLTHLRAALELRPWHLPSNRLLCLALVFSDQEEEAVGALRTAQAFYPEDPGFKVIEAYLHALRGRTGKVAAVIARLKEMNYAPGQLEVLEFGTELLAHFRYELTENWDGFSPPPPAQQLAQFPRLLRLMMANSEARAQLLPPFIERTLLPMATALYQSVLTPAKAHRTIDDALTPEADAVLWFFKGSLLFKDSMDEPGPAQTAMYEKIAAAYGEAATRISMFGPAISANGSLGSAFVSGAVHAATPNNGSAWAETRQRAITAWHQALRVPSLKPHWQQWATDFILRAEDVELARAVLRHLPPDQARRAEITGRIYLWEGNLQRSLAVCRENLTRFPEDSGLKNLEAKVQQAMKP